MGICEDERKNRGMQWLYEGREEQRSQRSKERKRRRKQGRLEGSEIG